MRLAPGLAACALLSAGLAFGESAPANSGFSAGLQRCAELELRVAGLFRIGTARLYLDQCDDAGRILDPIPKQFSLELARSFRGADLIESARSSLKDNLALETADDLPEVLRCLADAYVDADSGDRFDVIYRPQLGLSLYLNNELVRRCDDAEGAANYFMIWFGEQPFHRRMRDRLLEQALGKPRSS